MPLINSFIIHLLYKKSHHSLKEKFILCDLRLQLSHAGWYQ